MFLNIARQNREEEICLIKCTMLYCQYTENLIFGELGNLDLFNLENQTHKKITRNLEDKVELT